MTQKLKRLESFETFNERKKRQQKLKENNTSISIDVPFWDEAIDTIYQQIKIIALNGGKIDWDILTSYVNSKFIMLGREITGKEEMVLSHIRDLLFHYYGDTFLNGDTGIATSTESLGAKSLVLSQLADKIFQKIMIESGRATEPEEKENPEPVAKVSLENLYDLPFEHRRVVVFEDFRSNLKQTLDKIIDEHGETALDFCLNKLEQYGGLNMDNIVKVMEQEEHKDLHTFLSVIVEEYIIDMMNVKVNEGAVYDKALTNQAKKLFSNMIVEQLFDKVKEHNEKGVIK